MIRAAHEDDEPALRRLDAATWSPRVSPGPPPDPGAPFLVRFGVDNVLVADAADEPVVGYLILVPWLGLESAARVVEVRGLAVAPAHQGEGIGAALIEAAIDRLAAAGARKVVLRVLSTNTGARRLYERLGFAVEGTIRGAFLLDGAYVDDLLMARNLLRETVVGIDVGGTKKGFHGCAIDGREIVGGPRQLADVEAAVDWVRSFAPTIVALDSPRRPAPDGARLREDERQLNREVCGIRWTPDQTSLEANPAYYGWVLHGFRLYEALAAALPRAQLIEVFPTASWTRWVGPRDQRRAAWTTAGMLRLGASALDLGTMEKRGALSQDDRDAVAAALTARLHGENRTQAFGEIIVPAGPLSS